ncbi:unnamed protein product [Thlaspi arvense]|uniref:Uncharacterized protein n=1 Tax=Thlaspi arvense TaxID=13288 RepID=A0AAU9T862_THLAR|nr:unnamed protein product [Thlaspi arvense]
MTKATFFAMFMVILVLGTVMKDTQGQELCHDLFAEPQICNPTQCANQCTAKWKGSGKCLGETKSCICTFKCKK